MAVGEEDTGQEPAEEYGTAQEDLRHRVFHGGAGLYQSPPDRKQAEELQRGQDMVEEQKEAMSHESQTHGQ